eukprot:783466-Rhodomonas_salina.1
MGLGEARTLHGLPQPLRGAPTLLRAPHAQSGPVRGRFCCTGVGYGAARAPAKSGTEIREEWY